MVEELRDELDVNHRRLCTDCGLQLPLKQFRRRARDSTRRFHQCGCCHARMERVRRQSRIIEREAGRVRDLVRPILQARREARRKTAVDSLIRRMGGPDRLAEKIKSALDGCIKVGRHRDAIRLLCAVQSIILAATEPKSDMGRMSDEQLREARRDALARTILSGDAEPVIRSLICRRRLENVAPGGRKT